VDAVVEKNYFSTSIVTDNLYITVYRKTSYSAFVRLTSKSFQECREPNKKDSSKSDVAVNNR